MFICCKNTAAIMNAVAAAVLLCCRSAPNREAAASCHCRQRENLPAAAARVPQEGWAPQVSGRPAVALGDLNAMNAKRAAGMQSNLVVGLFPCGSRPKLSLNPGGGVHSSAGSTFCSASACIKAQ